MSHAIRLSMIALASLILAACATSGAGQTVVRGEARCTTGDPTVAYIVATDNFTETQAYVHHRGEARGYRVRTQMERAGESFAGITRNGQRFLCLVSS